MPRADDPPDSRPATRRLFIGLELPEACRHALAHIDRVDGVRWLREELLHVTLAFLGEVEAEHESRLRAALLAVRVPAFTLGIAGVGTFGGSRPRVVWAGVRGGHPHLPMLHGQISDAVMHAGLAPDQGPFHAHVTLGRVRSAARSQLEPFVQRYRDEEFGTFTVSDVVLFRSVLSPKGPTYTVELRQAF